MHRFICILCTSRSIKNYSIPYDFSDTFGVIFLSAISPVSYLHRGLAWFLISSNSVSGMSSVITDTIPALLLKSCHFTAALVNPGSSVQSMSTFLHATALSLLMCRLLSSLGRRPFWEPLLPLRLPTIDFNSVWTPERMSWADTQTRSAAQSVVPASEFIAGPMQNRTFSLN